MHQDDTECAVHGESDFTPLVRRFNDRRQGSPMPILLELVKQIHESQKILDKKLTDHMAKESDELAQAVRKILDDSFPEGDPAGHRRYHEASIAKAEAEAKFWQEMRLAATKWAGLGALGFVATALWVAFKAEVHK